jgi:hypothetical protein
MNFWLFLTFGGGMVILLLINNYAHQRNTEALLEAQRREIARRALEKLNRSSRSRA